MKMIVVNLFSKFLGCRYIDFISVHNSRYDIISTEFFLDKMECFFVKLLCIFVAAVTLEVHCVHINHNLIEQRCVFPQPSKRHHMMRKRQTFYFDLDAEGKYRIYEGRIVQARVIAVAEKVIRVEVFGVETSILARDLAWDWIGDAHERFSVGDEVLVRILNVRRNSLEDLGIRADIKSTSENTDRDNLQKCRIQGKYAGKVTDVHKGVVYVRLANGVNAVAHSCYDYRMPGKKDDVSFAVTHLDVERGIALGIITRIIRQNL